MICLIHPPVAKPCEPPAGLGRLAGLLAARQLPYRLLDANLEGLLFLLQQTPLVQDTWTRRALIHKTANLDKLRNPATYHDFKQYQNAVLEINRVLKAVSQSSHVEVSLGNYLDPTLSPQASRDLLQAFENYQENIFYPYFKTRLEEILGTGAYRFVGLSLNYLNQALCTFALAGYLRHAWPQLKLIAGGGLITSWLNLPGWRNPFNRVFDHLVAGPGEGPLLEIIGQQHPGPQTAMPSFIQLPLKEYLSPGPILPYNGSYGCFWAKCAFCPEQAEQNRYQALPPEEIKSALPRLVQRARARLLHICDNALSPRLLKGLIEHPPGSAWYGFARITKELAKPAYTDALRDCGCVMLKLGVESGAQSVLDALCKGTQVDLISRVLRNLQRAGIATYVYLLFGTPAEDYSCALQTREFILKHVAEINFLNLAVFNLPVASRLATDCHTRPFYQGDLSLYTDFEHPRGWHRRRVRQFLQNEVTAHPEIRPIILRTPPLFTSNHAPFFADNLAWQ